MNPYQKETDWFGLYAGDTSADDVLFPRRRHAKPSENLALFEDVADDSPDPVAHPAKMSLPLLKKILATMAEFGWLETGQTVVDPFGGRGSTAAVWCAMHPDNRAATVEIEPHFVAMQQSVKDGAEKRLGRPLRWEILQGDSRRADELLADAGVGVTSPPYAGSLAHEDRPNKHSDAYQARYGPKRLPSMMDYGAQPGQIGNLPDPVGVLSPPYSQTEIIHVGHSIGDAWRENGEPAISGPLGNKRNRRYGFTDGQIGQMPDPAPAAILSPPYGEGVIAGKSDPEAMIERSPSLKGRNPNGSWFRALASGYVNSPGNIDNLGDGPPACVTGDANGCGEIKSPYEPKKTTGRSRRAAALPGRGEHGKHSQTVQFIADDSEASAGADGYAIEDGGGAGSLEGQDTGGQPSVKDQGGVRHQDASEHQDGRTQPTLPNGSQEGSLREVRGDRPAVCSPSKHGPSGQQQDEPGGPLHELPPLGAQEGVLGGIPGGVAVAEVGESCGLDAQTAEDGATSKELAGQTQSLIGCLSPPYETAIHRGNGIDAGKLTGNRPGPGSQAGHEGYAAVLSPPFEAQSGGCNMPKGMAGGEAMMERHSASQIVAGESGYGDAGAQIGNTQNETYASACGDVYKALARAGVKHLALVTKNPTRQGKLRRLDKLTARLLREAGYRVVGWRRAWLFLTDRQVEALRGQDRLPMETAESKRVTGRLSFFRRLHMKRGGMAAAFEDVFFAELAE